MDAWLPQVGKVTTMPIFKAGGKLVYYAHVPKCAGSALEVYVHERFGSMALLDQAHTGQAPQDRWSRTSPQHIDTASLSRLFPLDFFDVVFTIVRHPVARLVSAYHFQLEVEKLVPPETGFSEWLLDIEERLSEERFVFDNHTLPMSNIVPEGAHVFHLEHGLDALVPFFDAIAGDEAPPRAIPKFERFGYQIGKKAPDTEAPELTSALITARDRENTRRARPIAQLAQKISNRLNH